MGLASSKLEKELGPEFPKDERYLGLENFGNTCYCNSVLQSLYFCPPFRRRILHHYETRVLGTAARRLADGNHPGRDDGDGGGAGNSRLRNGNTTRRRRGARQEGGSPSRNPNPNLTKSEEQPRTDMVSSVFGSMFGKRATGAPPSSSSSTTTNPTSTPSSSSTATASATSSSALSSSSAANTKPKTTTATTTATAATAAAAAAATPTTTRIPPSSSSHAHSEKHYQSATSATRHHATDPNETILSTLGELFYNISHSVKRTGCLPPAKFVTRLKKENDLFRGHMHQDAHEFLNYTLNVISDLLEKELKERVSRHNHPQHHPHVRPGQVRGITPSTSSSDLSDTAAGGSTTSSASSNSTRNSTAGGHGVPPPTFIQEIFGGMLTNETKCLSCETVTSKDEAFLDLSLDVESNTSITHNLRNFSSVETLSGQDKFYCDNCCSLQEAQKRMRVKQLPNILVVHLKRFKYMEEYQRFQKLSHRVAFPFELRLCNTSDEAEDPDRAYDLFSVVVHSGSSPNHGHYVSLVKSHSNWLLFDDDAVELVEELTIQKCFGATQEVASSTSTGYLLFYQSRHLPKSLTV